MSKPSRSIRKQLATLPLKLVFALGFIAVGLFVGATVRLQCERPDIQAVRCRVTVAGLDRLTLKEDVVEDVTSTFFESRAVKRTRGTGTSAGDSVTTTKDVMVLRGNVDVDHGFPEDHAAVSGFLDDAGGTSLVLEHPPPPLRRYGGGAAVLFGLLILVGVVSEPVAMIFGKSVYHEDGAPGPDR